jgi:hypothetical protein
VLGVEGLNRLSRAGFFSVGATALEIGIGIGKRNRVDKGKRANYTVDGARIKF